jgi:hypothetical protein
MLNILQHAVIACLSIVVISNNGSGRVTLIAGLESFVMPIVHVVFLDHRTCSAVPNHAEVLDGLIMVLTRTGPPGVLSFLNRSFRR